MTSPITKTLHTSSPRYLKVGEVAERFGVCVPTIWRYAKTRHGFPQPVRLSKGCTRCSEAALLTFKETLTP